MQFFIKWIKVFASLKLLNQLFINNVSQFYNKFIKNYKKNSKNQNNHFPS